MSLLVGRHVNRIDRKGRVSVPKLFRDFILSRSGGFAGIFAYSLYQEPAVEACDGQHMARVAESLEDLPMNSEDQKALALMLLERAHQLSFDPEGRIVLPEELIVHAGLDGDALFVGRGFRFQIWNPGRYDEVQAPVLARLRTEMPPLRLRPGPAAGPAAGEGR